MKRRVLLPTSEYLVQTVAYKCSRKGGFRECLIWSLELIPESM